MLTHIQNSFLAELAAGVPLSNVLADNRLKWGPVAAWRRWSPDFRRAYDRAVQGGLPKRRQIRFAERLLQSGGFICSPALLQLMENARAERTRARGHACASTSTSKPAEEKVEKISQAIPPQDTTVDSRH